MRELFWAHWSRLCGENHTRTRKPNRPNNWLWMQFIVWPECLQRRRSYTEHIFEPECYVLVQMLCVCVRVWLFVCRWKHALWKYYSAEWHWTTPRLCHIACLRHWAFLLASLHVSHEGDDMRLSRVRIHLDCGCVRTLSLSLSCIFVCDSMWAHFRCGFPGHGRFARVSAHSEPLLMSTSMCFSSLVDRSE